MKMMKNGNQWLRFNHNGLLFYSLFIVFSRSMPSLDAAVQQALRGIIMTFSELQLCKPILDAVKLQGYESPTPVQAESIPAIISGKDVMAAAQTGTGKTAGFTLPILHRLSENPKKRSGNGITTLVLTPTRELAAQVEDNIKIYSQFLNLKTCVVFGGVKINPQMMKLRGGADILVATPGRLLDLYSQNAIHFNQLTTLVLDEADRMLDMGFIHDIKRILRLLPAKRQNLLFSATFSHEIRELAKGLINDPVEISVTPENSTTELVDQLYYPVDKSKKIHLLNALIKQGDWQQALVFSRTKHGANRIVKKLEAKGITAAAIHGNKSQGARTKALGEFKTGDIRILVATDIAARGIDIDQLPQVVNFDLPNVAEDYVHRIGRTGRAGATGKAISFVTAEDVADLSGIQRLIKMVIPRQEHPDYVATESVPEVTLDTRPIKPKKPKKPKQSKGLFNAQGQRKQNDGTQKPRRRRRNPNKVSVQKVPS